MKNKKRLINLTPHPIDIFDDDRKVLTIPSSGMVRLSENVSLEETVTLNNVEVKIYKKSYGSASLPEPQEGTYFIVSLPVALAFPERSDFIIANDIVRDENGRIVGCRSFARMR